MLVTRITREPSCDLNYDGALTPADAAIELQIAAGGSASCDAADVGGDDRVTSLRRLG